MIGNNVKAKKPKIQGDKNAIPCLNSLRAIGDILRNDFLDGRYFRKFDSSSNMGVLPS